MKKTNKLALVACGSIALLLVGCNSGGSGTPNNSTLYTLTGANMTNSASGGCSYDSGASTINCSVGGGNGYSGTFQFQFTSSSPASYLNIGQAQQNAADAGLNNITFNALDACTQTATTGNFECTFSIQGAASPTTGTFTIPLSGSLGNQSYITVKVQ